jgi:hypothetical protein
LIRPAGEVPSIAANRTNDPRRISSDKTLPRNVLGDYGTRRDDRILADCYAADDGRAGCDPPAFLNHDGLSDCDGASLRGFERMARRDDAHIRPDHHIVCDLAASKVIESAVLIYEDIMPNADFVPTSSINQQYKMEGSVFDQYKALVYLFTDKFAEQGPDFVRIVERQTVKSGGDRHRSFDVCQHGR